MSSDDGPPQASPASEASLTTQASGSTEATGTPKAAADSDDPPDLTNLFRRTWRWTGERLAPRGLVPTTTSKKHFQK